MSRLPVPGQDNGTWGNVLNDFLGQSHASDGTLKAGSVGASQVQDGALPKTKLDTTTQTSLTKADGSLQASNNLSDVTAGTARTNLGLGTAATMTPATLAADSAFSGTYVQLFNVKKYGATGDGSTDDTAAIQAAIDACSSAKGGNVYLPAGIYRVSTLTLKANVTITSLQGQFSYSNSPVIIRSNGSGNVIDTPVSAINSCAVVGLYIDGHSTGSVGINFRNVSNGRVAQCLVVSCLDQGILHTAGAACTFEDILITNCLANRSRSGVAGALELRGTDDYVHRVESGCSLTTGKSDSNLYCWGVYVQHDANFLSHVVAEISDGGFLVTGHYNQFVACRGDLNWSNGWKIDGPGGTLGKNMFSSCQALNNGRDAANTYSGFLITLSGGNVFSACRNTQNGAGSGSSKYAFEDQTAYSALNFKNTYAACDGDYATALFSVDAFAGSSPFIASQPYRPTDGSTSIDVSETTFLVLNNSAPTTITALTGGSVGQRLVLLPVTSNTSLANNAAIHTSTGATKSLTSDRPLVLVNYNNVWYDSDTVAVAVIGNVQTLTSSGTYTPPAGALYLEVDALGAGGGGGGGGSALSSGGVATQVGGGGGAAAVPVKSIVAATTLTITIGSGGTAGTGGVVNGNAGGNGGNGGNTLVTGTGLSITAPGGAGGKGGGANSTSVVGGGMYGVNSTTTNQGLGCGGYASSTVGAAGGNGTGIGGGAGSGGAGATATNGGLGGNAGTVTVGGGNSLGQGATAAGSVGATATAAGAGAGGGGGGAPTGAGGNGGVGGSGLVTVRVIA